VTRWATLSEASEYLHMSERTMYRLRGRGVIPSHNPTGGHVLFDLDELDAWVRASADPRAAATTAEEYATAARQHVRNRRRR
jgi:excisionase family DNA binding protein